LPRNPKESASLFGRTAVYAAGFAVARGARFALAPVLITLLPPAELGIVGLIEMIAALLAGIMGLKLEVAVTRFYWPWHAELRDRVGLGSLWLTATIFNIAFGLLLVAAGRPAFAFIATNLRFHPFVTVAVIVAMCQWQYTYLLQVLRIKEEAKEYTTIYTAVEVVVPALAIGAVASTGGGAEEYAFGLLAGWLLMTVIVLWRLASHLQVRWWKRGTFDALHFGLPLLPRDLTGVTGGVIDRFFLDKMVGVEALGLYTAGTKVGSAIIAANFPLKQAWIPHVMKAGEMATADRSALGYVATVYIALLSTLALALSLAGSLFFGTFGVGYEHLSRAVPLFVLTFLLAAVGSLVNVGIYVGKATRILFWIGVSQMIFQILAFPVAIRAWGYIGAALVLCIMNTGTLLAGFFASQKLYRIQYRVGLIAPLAAGIVLIVALRLRGYGEWMPYVLAAPSLLIWIPLLGRNGSRLRAAHLRLRDATH
jgi:O-antigen/teichoic acid export membrane protein